MLSSFLVCHGLVLMEAFLEPVRETMVELVPIAGIFAALAVAVQGWRAIATRLGAGRELGTNLGLLLFNKAIWVPLLTIPMLAFYYGLPHYDPLVEFWDLLPHALVVVIAIAMVDFAAYWRHRLEHSPALWRIHATHHADESMGWLTLHRKHPLGEGLSMFCDLIPVMLLGLPLWAIAAAAVVRTWWGYFIHADVPWTLGLFGRVLMSPAAHRLHHIRDEELMGANYGNTITLWDYLFGTYVDPAPYVACDTGIAEGTHNLAGEFLRPFEARYRRQGRFAEPTAASDQSAA